MAYTVTITVDLDTSQVERGVARMRSALDALASAATRARSAPAAPSGDFEQRLGQIRERLAAIEDQLERVRDAARDLPGRDVASRIGTFAGDLAALRARLESIEAGFREGGASARQLETRLNSLHEATARTGAKLGEFSANLDRYQSRTSGLGNAIGSMATSLSRLGTLLSAAGIGFGLYQVTQALGAIVTYSSNLDRARVAFATFVGDAERASRHVEELKKFARETPFEFGELVQVSRFMQALGFEMERVVPLLKRIGDATAALGGSSDILNRIVLALGQMQAKGRVMTQEMNQLSEAGIPAWRILEEQLGRSRAELMKMVEEGQISAETFIAAFERFSEIHFGDMMQQQSRMFVGALSNIKDALFQLAESSFRPVFSELEELLVRISDRLTDAAARSRSLSEALTSALGEVVGRLTRQLGEELTKKPETIAGGIKEAFSDYLTATEGISNRFLDQLKRAKSAADILSASLKTSADTLVEVDNLFGRLVTGSNFLKEFYRGVKEGLSGEVTLEPPPGTPRSLLNLAAPLPKESIADKLGIEQTEQHLERLRRLIEDLRLRIGYYGQATEEARVKQELFKIGLSETNSALARQALELARTFDEMKRQAEIAEQEARLRMERQSANWRRIESIMEQIRRETAEAGLRDAQGISVMARRQLTLTEQLKNVEMFDSVLQSVQMSGEEMEAFWQQVAGRDKAQLLVELDRELLNAQSRFAQLQAEIDGTSGALTEWKIRAEQSGLIARAMAAGDSEVIERLEQIKDLLGEIESKERVVRWVKELTGALESANRTTARGEASTAVERLAATLSQMRDSFITAEQLRPIVDLVQTSGATLEYADALAAVQKQLAGLRAILGDEQFARVTQEITRAFLGAQSADLEARARARDAVYQREVERFEQMRERELELTERERLERALQTDAYRDLTDAQREHLRLLADEADAQERARRALEEWRDSVYDLADVFDRAFDRLREGGVKAFLRSILDDFRRAIQSMVSLALAMRVAGMLFPGVPANAQASMQPRGFFGTLFGSLFGLGAARGVSGGGLGGGGLFGGAVGQVGGVPIFSFASTAATGGGAALPAAATLPALLAPLTIPSDVLGILGPAPQGPPLQSISGQIATAAGIDVLLGRTAGPAPAAVRWGTLGQTFAAMAPLLGLSLGPALGGQSTIGQILGGAGGLLAGGSVMTAVLGASKVASVFGGGAFGANVAGLLANPITWIVAGGLLIGAWLFGRAAQRRADERVREQGYLDARAKIQELIRQVRLDRVDGDQALAQALDIRNQYYAVVSQLKTKSARENALHDYVPALDQLIAELRREAERQIERRNRVQSMVPEFASGGLVAARVNGLVPGVYTGRDQYLVSVGAGEVILTPWQVWRLGGPAAMRAAGVPGYAAGGLAAPAAPSPAGGPVTLVVENVTVEVGRRDATAVVFEGVRTADGQRVIVETVRRAARYGDL